MFTKTYSLFFIGTLCCLNGFSGTGPACALAANTNNAAATEARVALQKVLDQHPAAPAIAKDGKKKQKKAAKRVNPDKTK